MSLPGAGRRPRPCRRLRRRRRGRPRCRPGCPLPTILLLHLLPLLLLVLLVPAMRLVVLVLLILLGRTPLVVSMTLTSHDKKIILLMSTLIEDDVPETGETQLFDPLF